MLPATYGLTGLNLSDDTLIWQAVRSISEEVVASNDFSYFIAHRVAISFLNVSKEKKYGCEQERTKVSILYGDVFP
jgi:hypothetical protein